MASLIHRWQLTENANDSVGTLHLTNNGDVTFSADGASFNGTNQWLSGTKTPPDTITMSIWTKQSALTDTVQFAFGGPTDSTDQSGFFMTSATTYLTHHSNGYFAVSSDFTSANFPSTGFTNIIITYDGATLCYYRNGTLIGSAAKTISATKQTDMYIGRYKGGWLMNGKLADARIYDYALSASEVSALYAAGPNPSSGPLRLAQVI